MTEFSRKLAAIVFTDIAGFTKLAGSDETHAAELLQTQRDILKPIVASKDGKWLKEIGDGVLLSFSSTTSALDCAVQIQNATKEIPDLNLRIGIHQGEVIEQYNDIIGDDVNIASRLEPFAAIGGIVVSDKIYRDLVSNTRFSFKLIGQPKLKGVVHPLILYSVISHGLPDTNISEVSAKLEKEYKNWSRYLIPAVVILLWIVYQNFVRVNAPPSVAILMMENMGDPVDEFWAQGISEDLIINVASAGLINVASLRDVRDLTNMELTTKEIGRRLNSRYVLTSSVLKQVNSFALRCQLLDTRSDNILFSLKWSEPLTNVGSITYTLTENILKSLDVSAGVKSPSYDHVDPLAYEYYLKGKYTWDKRQNQEDMEIARGFLQQALEIDEHFLQAKLFLGQTHRESYDFDKANQLFAECIELSKTTGDELIGARAQKQLGDMHLALEETEEALKYYQIALMQSRDLGDLNSEEQILRNIGNAYYISGDNETALKFYTESLSLAKKLGHKRSEGESLHSFGNIYEQTGELEQALDSYARSLEIFRELGEKNRESYALLTMGLVNSDKGNYTEAIDYLAQSLQISSELNDHHVKAYTLNYLGDVHREIGMLDESREYYSQSLQICEAINAEYLGAIIHQSLGEMHMEASEYDSSYTHFLRSIPIWIKHEETQQHLETLSLLALAELRGGQPEPAMEKVHELETILGVLRLPIDEMVTSHWNLFNIYREREMEVEADKYLDKAYNGLMILADNIKNVKDRDSFLNGVEKNRSIIESYKKKGE